MTLTSVAQRRIAAMLATVTGGRTTRRYAGLDLGRATLAAGLRSGGVGPSAGAGPTVSPERLALSSLVRAGRITQREADEYLAAVYPAQRFAGGRFGDREQSVAEADRLSPAAIRKASDGNPTVGVEVATPLRVGRLPATYDQAQVQDALEGLAEGVSGRLRVLTTSPPKFPAHSIDGKALAPGSVPVDALEQRELAQALSWPTQDQAIELNLRQSPTMDRFVFRASTGISGPGRIWEATARPSSRARVSAGPTRYRLIGAGQRFGVMSCRLPPDANMGASNTPGILFQYGIIVRAIPHYLGRIPSRILAVESVGDSPVSFRSLFDVGSGGASWTSGGTTRDFWWNRTQEEHQTLAPYPFAESFGADANLYPAGTSLRDINGFTFQLVTGRDSGEVFRQLCSRVCLGRAMVKDGHGPGASLPSGLPMEAPTVPSVADWVGPTYTHRVEGYDLTTAGTRVANGVPFSYDDCAALAATETHFSVVVQVVGEKLLSQGGLASLATPEEWHRNGLRLTETVAGRLRSWALDIIVD